MRRDEIADLAAFVVVAEERSFTKAAQRLGMAQSALSQIVRRIEGRLGMRLLSRTTRSVAPTEAGERLIATLGPMLHDLDTAVASLGDLRDRPSGTIRITTVEHAAKTIIVPAMKRLLPDNPDITVDLTIDYGLADVVADRFDAGVRLGGEVAKDMIAVRIGPDIPMAIVGSPDYFRRHTVPNSPAQLIDHRAINLRLPTSGTLNKWRLMRGGRETRVRIDGPLVFNTIDLILDAALDGHGLAYLPLDQVQANLDTGRLTRVLSKFTPDLPGYHLYYPHRRHASSAFSLFVEAIRFRT
ncbi:MULTISPECIES: LysR family transcriptional regulator [Rhizobium]|uniref:HTH-type transcriptional regulator TtuA n=1 Tax=Rhizobium tropici TaxID=398 RepID=A0A6P1CHS8_RHITR|nr:MULTISPECIES: LysR family transcriptional regulator [Rhizobium]AGB73214.1 transcriptional regulator, LysR family [Rhizobium tropici CIAT 899]MBB4245524.1 DNA-binding transcriptional LysR family regulator [Rhizobium tropici]MBB5596834.1 DNA-binding transcriptional LysR family regulator [Rhizobium tropici]MBB6495876.1 DNA-binding transcriptional LysR family regulator [Rhizobium tropici]NEV15313.1 LysR family transcriptional regulator [Rhizobium tropici]